MNRFALSVGLAAALTGCVHHGQTIPAFSPTGPRFASADYTVLGRTDAKTCGTYVFIDWAHLFKNEGAGTTATNPLAMLGGLTQGSEEKRALYAALEREPEATHLLDPRIHTSWHGLRLTPVPLLWFGTRCATVEAEGVQIGQHPVPNAN